MNDNHKTTLRERLDMIGQAVDAKLKQLNERGELSGTHEIYAGDLKKRQRALREKFDAAVDDNDAWNATKEEIEVDLFALASEFRGWEERLDSSAMKARGPEDPDGSVGV